MSMALLWLLQAAFISLCVIMILRAVSSPFSGKGRPIWFWQLCMIAKYGVRHLQSKGWSLPVHIASEAFGFLKRTLGVKCTTCNWTLLQECGHLPLQLNWFKSVVKTYNSMLECNSVMVRKVLQADIKMHPRVANYWTAQTLDGFPGLYRCDSFVYAVKNGPRGSNQASGFYGHPAAQASRRLEQCWCC